MYIYIPNTKIWINKLRANQSPQISLQGSGKTHQHNNPFQFGFRKESIIYHLSCISNHVQINYIMRRITFIVSLDVSKAFWDTSLLMKLVKVKLSSAFIALMGSYKQDRSFQAHHQQYYSTPKRYCSASPSLLYSYFFTFSLFINDSPLPTSSLIKLTESIINPFQFGLYKELSTTHHSCICNHNKINFINRRRQVR